MVERSVSPTASRKVELAIGQLVSLSVPPCVAVQYLSEIVQGRLSPGSVEGLIACEPALAARVLSLAQQHSAGSVDQRHAVGLVTDRLDADVLRDALLEMKVSAAFEIEFGRTHPAVPARQDLILHSLAVACCARRIAETSGQGVDPNLAYSAGLLHDIGKLALQDIMPKSLTAIVQETEATKAGLYAIEQKHLGTNHAMLGKLLAHRWRLPGPIVTAIWLHHSDAVTLLEGMPETALARIVWAANHLARHAEIGQSGSFNAPESVTSMAGVVGTDVTTLQQIRDGLSDELAGRIQVLGLDMPNATARYCDLVQTVAARLSRQHTESSAENRTLKMASSYLDFARAFLLSVGPSDDSVEIAQNLAQRWQRFFQTGSVCLYLSNGVTPGVVDTVLVEALGHSHRIVLESPSDIPLVPRPLSGGFALVDARHYIDWLVAQIDVDFDLGRTKLVPLVSEGRIVAVMAFEMNLPGDARHFAEKFETAASMAGTVLALAGAGEYQSRFSERLVRAMGGAEGRDEPGPPADSIDALAEMAAGVAHELNNPLSVISGRAELLAQTETDEERKQDLDQIQENAGAASWVVDDVMSFAEPSPPRSARTEIRQIMEEAVQLAAQKSRVDHINAQIEIEGTVPDVLVDSGQIVSALANVISNAVESYVDAAGPVKIVVESVEGDVRLKVGDLGCGMDPDTLEKATYPFFSAKPAGRKRGMGLAYATRLIRQNKGSLAIESTLGEGTTVAITLPRG